jgi:choline dehydrogenase-like flavoprotein
MPHIDLEALPSEANLDCDLCIIGSGPAGATLAREFAKSKWRVTLLESGGFTRQPHADALNEIESVGWPRVMDQWSVRNRIVGGSSHTWCGRSASFDAIDLERREWVAYSGWPFGIDHLEPFLERAAPYVGLSPGTGFSDERFWTIAKRRPPRGDLDPEVLLPFFWQFSRDETNRYDYMRFGRHLSQKLGPNVTLVTNATVVQINPAASGAKVESVEVASTDGRRRTLSARAIAVCAGGIENARILLSSNRVVTPGLGNQNGLVGRFLMDHPRGSVGTFRIAGSKALQNRFTLYNVKDATGSHMFRHGMRLSPKIQRKEKLLNCSAWVFEAVMPDDPWDALKRMLRGKAEWPKDAFAIGANLNLVARGLHDHFVAGRGLPRKLERLELQCMCEQVPDPESRVTLSDRCDRFGMRLPRIDWRINADEHRTMRRTAELVVGQLIHLGIEPPVLDEWVRNGEAFPEGFRDIAHPTGTTRMAEDPAKGVVDQNCEVHGVSGLFVAGTSVFPTAGHANPTQMIVAMALRLADHLKLRLAEETRQESPLVDSLQGGIAA